jgi:membrane dipeptidase
MAATEFSNRLHDEAIIIDGRDPTHLMYQMTMAEKPEYMDILHAGGLTAVVADAAWVDDNFGQAARAVAAWHRRVTAMNGRARIIYTAADVRRAKENGQVGFILSFQSPAPVEDDLNLVDMWQKVGIRVMQLTYQTRNLVGDGCGEKSDCGLSRFGEQLVARLNETGIVVDLSHAGERTAREAAACSSQPVIFSHTNARALCDSPRNAADALLKQVAAKGGVVGVSAYSAIVKKGGGETGTTLADYLEHVDYLLNLVGEDHVGLGFDAGELRSPAEAELLHGRIKSAGAAPKHRYVADINTRTKARNVTQGLARRGYNERLMRKILGENFLRVFDQVWSQTGSGPGGEK